MTTNAIHIAVDVMGGDYGPSVTIPAVIRSLSQNPALTVTLLGRQTSLEKHYSAQLNAFGSRVSFVNCDDEVMMNEKPSIALRNKKNSSMFRAVSMVGDRRADGCVSAGNTGAFMAMGKLVIKTFPGIERPAVCAQVPTEKGHCLMLDLGANVDCQPDHFLQFAIMGSVMASVLDGIQEPKVGLLNIGEEEIKGNEQVQRVAELLKTNKQIHYAGFVEGDAIYKGVVDVVVCDGFVGNVVLKASEGVARLVTQKITEAYKKSALARLLGFFSKGLLESMFKDINPSRYNGASFLGLQGVVIVSHGKTDIEGFSNAILLACRQVELKLVERVQSGLAIHY